MLDRPPTTKHSRWQKAQDVKGGQYFKYMSQWYLAITDAREAEDAGSTGRLYRWVIRAYNRDGFDQWIGIYKASLPGDVEVVEVMDGARRPGPFTPARLRAKARAQREEAERQLALAQRKEVLARRLEEGSIAG
jgi:hypothetical protein